MRTEPEDQEKIHIRRDPCLVVWEALIRSLWNRDAIKEVHPGNYELLLQLDEAELKALHHLVGAIQRSLPDALAPVDPRLIAEGKRWLLSRPK